MSAPSKVRPRVDLDTTVEHPADCLAHSAAPYHDAPGAGSNDDLRRTGRSDCEARHAA